MALAEDAIVPTIRVRLKGVASLSLWESYLTHQENWNFLPQAPLTDSGNSLRFEIPTHCLVLVKLA